MALDPDRLNNFDFEFEMSCYGREYEGHRQAQKQYDQAKENWHEVVVHAAKLGVLPVEDTHLWELAYCLLDEMQEGMGNPRASMDLRGLSHKQVRNRVNKMAGRKP